MCRAFEEVAFEAKHEQAVDTARKLLALGQLSIEDIASAVKLPVEEVRALAKAICLKKSCKMNAPSFGKDSERRGVLLDKNRVNRRCCPV